MEYDDDEDNCDGWNNYAIDNDDDNDKRWFYHTNFWIGAKSVGI